MTKLIFPEKVLHQHLVVLGKTGAGKSSALRHIVEHLLSKKKRVCVIDPKGDWNGLKVSGDGTGPGFPVILFGNFKETAGKQIPADVPINEHSGKHIAELAASGNRPCVVGMRGWFQAAMHRFWIDFASTLFNANSGEFYLVVDEVHNFAPKQQVRGSNEDNASIALHWANRLINEGRGLGLVNLIASQRPQKVHNDTLDACETLVAMRVVHKAARDSVEDWLQGAGDKKLASEILASLAGMKRGEAYVWSPEIEFGPVRVTFPMFQSFDSFAPPQLQTKVSTKDWGTVDLEAVKEKLAAVIEKAKAGDPKELLKRLAESQKRVTQLERQLERIPANGDAKVSAATNQVLRQYQSEINGLRKALQEAMKFIIEIEAKEFFGKSDQPLDEAAITKALSGAAGQITKMIEQKLDARNREMEVLKRDGRRLVTKLSKLLKDDEVAVSVTVKHQESFAVETKPAAQKPAASTNGQRAPREFSYDGPLPEGEAKVLAALIQYPDGLSRGTIGALTGYTKKSTRNTYIQRLGQKGYVTSNGDLIIATPEGMDAMPDYDPLPTGQALIDYWLARLPEGESKVLEALIESYPNALTREEVSERTGYDKKSTRNTYIQRLGQKQLLVTRGESVFASESLFLN